MTATRPRDDRPAPDARYRVGIEKGKPYDPDQAMQGTLDESAREAHALLSQWYDAGFPVMNPGIRWFPAATAEMVKAAQSGYANPSGRKPRPASSPIGFQLIHMAGSSCCSRLYGPEKPLFDHTWKLPDVQKVAEH